MILEVTTRDGFGIIHSAEEATEADVEKWLLGRGAEKLWECLDTLYSWQREYCEVVVGDNSHSNCGWRIVWPRGEVDGE